MEQSGSRYGPFALNLRSAKNSLDLSPTAVQSLLHVRRSTMSLYYEAARVLTNSDSQSGSLKSRVYGNKDLKSSPAQLFGLLTEATKWSAVLKDVIEKSGILQLEKKVTRRKFSLPLLFIVSNDSDLPYRCSVSSFGWTALPSISFGHILLVFKQS